MSDSDTPQYAVTVMADYGSTRVVLTGDPRLVARDVIVQQKGADGAWVENLQCNIAIQIRILREVDAAAEFDEVGVESIHDGLGAVAHRQVERHRRALQWEGQESLALIAAVLDH